MKKINLFFLIIAVAIFTLTSCDNSESIDTQTPTQSESVKSSMQELKTHFNADGSLIAEKNKMQNVLFDYGFSFKFPVTIGFTKDKVVTYTDFNSLVKDIIVMNDASYINGIVFPFEVRVYEKSLKSVVLKTIANEKEFILLNELSWNKNRSKDDDDDDDDDDDNDDNGGNDDGDDDNDNGGNDDDDDDDECYYDENVVCVEVNCYDDDSFIITFPNTCYAEYYGFDQDDYINCEEKCFDYNYPMTIINSCGYTVEIESDVEWARMLYYNEGEYDFVFPFSVTMISDGSVEQIMDATEYESLLMNCTVAACNCPDVYQPICIDGANGVLIFDNLCLLECAGYDGNNAFFCAPRHGN